MNTWRKSSRSGSGAQDINCVELAALPNAIGIRDSKNPNAGHLTLTSDQFTTLLANIRADKFTV
jgi:uncharacterized protein DUF397